jgi:hypothetical protein
MADLKHYNFLETHLLRQSQYKEKIVNLGSEPAAKIDSMR